MICSGIHRYQSVGAPLVMRRAYPERPRRTPDARRPAELMLGGPAGSQGLEDAEVSGGPEA
ncbi:hypothetical protein NBRGN_027_03070 [Nocardia brasiliensis NBRC 14402]|nr:hypothetical protein NBRGN_027_03070 [Nocardia brasiliensis NBRC 14402]